WIYTTDGQLVRFVQNPTTVAADFAPGLYIVKMQNKNVIRTRKITVK
ncbi:MAG: T9SS type A sorting domain-containing protein, partial [Prevotella sp.]|nr:T9SS type A sorting domain-containing protein [Prevotella sp.]